MSRHGLWLFIVLFLVVGVTHAQTTVHVDDDCTAPGTGTPKNGGLTYREAHLALEMVAASGRLRSFEIVEVELNGPRPGEVLVEIVAAGMCHTDQSMRAPFRDISFPVVLGHEGAGRIAEVGEGVDLSVAQPSDRVIVRKLVAKA